MAGCKPIAESFATSDEANKWLKDAHCKDNCEDNGSMILGWPDGNGKVTYHAFRFCKKKEFGDAIGGILEGAAGMSKELKDKDKDKKKKKKDDDKDAVEGIMKGAEGWSKELKEKDQKKKKRGG